MVIQAKLANSFLCSSLKGISILLHHHHHHPTLLRLSFLFYFNLFNKYSLGMYYVTDAVR